MALQTFKSAKAAAAFAKNFKRNGRKRQPVLVALKGGQVIACSRRTARKLTTKKGSGNKIVQP
jgi:uroporphyrinogen-III synthase